MNNDLLEYLKNYSQKTDQINRLVISSFLGSLNINGVKNGLIDSFLIKKNDSDFQKFQEFHKLYKISCIEELIQVFEYVISPEDKIVTGAVYTPLQIREFIVNACIKDNSNTKRLRVCDPAVGCAGFLISVAKKIRSITGSSYKWIFENQIYGLDIQDYAVTRSKSLLALLAISEGEDEPGFAFNIYSGNALDFTWYDLRGSDLNFDVVVGNPPYVCSRNIESDTKKLLEKWEVCSTGHPDLYIPFFQLGVESLVQNGVLGFITMSTFFKSANGRALRAYLSDRQLDIKIVDFGSHQIFDSKSTYTCLCFISNKKSMYIKYKRIGGDSLKARKPFQKIKFKELNNHAGWNLNQSSIINKIENSGLGFGESYRTSSGIATLKNSVYIFKPTSEDENYYYLESDKIFPIEKGVCKNIINSNKLTKVSDISTIVEKIIYPYKYDTEGSAIVIKETEFKSEFPKALAYLKTRKRLLSKRDKGKGNYPAWYAFGRNQSLEQSNVKMFFPHISSHSPCFVINEDQDLFFYNGLAVISDDLKEMKFLKKVMSSQLFWFYIRNSSRPYGSGYFSLSRNYIKNFGIYEFSDEEKCEIIDSNDQEVEEILGDKYDVRVVSS